MEQGAKNSQSNYAQYKRQLRWKPPQRLKPAPDTIPGRLSRFWRQLRPRSRWCRLRACVRHLPCLTVTGTGGVPFGGVSAVVLNVTAVDQTANGFFTVFPTGSALPTASNLNWTPGVTVPNRVIVPVGTGGQVSIYNGLGSADAVVDVNGYITDSSAVGAHFTPVFPTRIKDTRNGPGTIGKIGANSTTNVQVSGVGGVPGNATAVILNVTVANPTLESDLFVWPADAAMPTAGSDLNFLAGATVPNLVVVKLSTIASINPTGLPGSINVYNPFGSTNLIIDVVGYYS